MRSRFRTVPLALAAVFALCALSAGSASALESLPRLYPAPTTKSIPFTGKSGQVSLVGRSILGEAVVDCTSSSVTGEFTTAKKIANTVLTISGCKTVGWSFGNKGSTETITTEPLTGELGYVNDTTKTKPYVGLMLGAEYKKGLLESKPTWAPQMTEYSGSYSDEWGPIRGELIGEAKPVNTFVKSGSKYTLTFAAGTKGYEPFWTAFEGGVAEQQLFWWQRKEAESKLNFSFTEEIQLTGVTGSEIEA